ncbi:hypothetical protein [Brevundimonas sp. A19_0]|uniref:hypothetical protein n=1 Tax=Brevundimonas sp. A19_0 TaxID=2821087 RepID=UPI001ADA9C8F|nr:hypothetical protein [Brevundimonas sp. A19_0]MBO9501005.1 hypothetical protein [Brevundimonas sp. A19_0]
MSSSDLANRAIESSRRLIGIIGKTLPQRRLAHDTNGLLMNYGGWMQAHMEIGIRQWRLDLDPRPEFVAGLNAIEQGIAEAIALNATPRDIDQLNLWIAQPIAYLMDRTLPVLQGTTGINQDLPSRTASDLLGDALFDRPYRDQLPALMTALGRRKAEHLALVTAQNQFALLDAAGDEARIAELAAEGDALYLRRAKDAYFEPAIILGGGEDNPIMLDWQLAAILKKVGFKSHSPNLWLWD